MRRRGLVIGGMILGLLMGCNNGGEDSQKVFLKSVVSLGNEFLNIFTSFGEMAGSALGFKTDPKKSDVRDYFNKVKKTVEGTRDKLNTMVADMKREGNPNAEATAVAVKTLIDSKLSKIIEGVETASGAIVDTGNDLLGNVAAGGSGDKAGAVGTGVEDLVKGIKSIVDVVLKEGKHDAGNDKAPVLDDGAAVAAKRDGNSDAGKLFSNTDAGAKAVAPKVAKDAAKAVGAVSGADILQAIAKGESGDAATLAKDKAGTAANSKNDAVVAGGIALRAMAKGGKFANSQDDTAKADIATQIKEVAVSAVAKALDTLTVAIRKTIDAGLKEIKEAMKINPETTPLNSDGTTNK